MAEFVGCRHFGGGAVTALAVFDGGGCTTRRAAVGAVGR